MCTLCELNSDNNLNGPSSFSNGVESSSGEIANALVTMQITPEVSAMLALGPEDPLQEGLIEDEVALEEFLNDQLSNAVSNTTFSGATYYFEDFEIEGVASYPNSLLLTSGGVPGPVNTSDSDTLVLEYPGDEDLTNSALLAFSGAGETYDASIIEFDVDVDDPTVTGISFNVFFGSEEFPEYSNSSFVDIGAIYVNGENYALFNNNPNTPLSVIDQNISQGNFIDNSSGDYATELDGFSVSLEVRAPLDFGKNTIKIGVADTGDNAYDSVLAVNEISFLTDGGVGGGVLTQIEGSEGDDNLISGPESNAIELIDGQDSITGTLDDLDGDVISGFGSDDQVVISGQMLSDEELSFDTESSVLTVNGSDGTSAGITFVGIPDTSQFGVAAEDGNSIVTIADEPTNTAPVAKDDSATTDAESAFAIDLLANDSDIDNDTLTLTSFTQPQNGSVIEVENGTVIYTPNAGFVGDDSFSYTVSDGQGGQDSAQVNVQVNEADVLIGTPTEEDDYLEGTSKADNINGLEGNDFIWGNDGNDRLRGGSGNDYIEGGAGNDRIWGNHGSDFLLGGDGDDVIGDWSGSSTLDGGAGNDRLYGGAGKDFLIGGEGDDTMHGGAHADTFLTGLGEDTVLDFDRGEDLLQFEGYDFGYKEGQTNPEEFLNTYGSFDNTDLVIDLGDGNRVRLLDQIDPESPPDSLSTLSDIIFTGAVEIGTDAPDTIIGTPGNDDIFGLGGNDIIYGAKGDDNVSGGSGSDNIEGGAGNDYLHGNHGSDMIFGRSGDDFLGDWAGSSYLDGGEGNDTLNAGAGQDTLVGGEGDDLMHGGGHDDMFITGIGHDVIEDFAINVDTLYIIDYDFGFEEGQIDPVNFMNDHSYFDGADLVIEFDADNTVRLQNQIDPANPPEGGVSSFASIFSGVYIPDEVELLSFASSEEMSFDFLFSEVIDEEEEPEEEEAEAENELEWVV